MSESILELNAPESNELVLDNLSPDDQKTVQNIFKEIDLSDSNSIITYGASSQNKIAAFSDSVLKNVKTKDTGAAGKLLTDLVVEIKNFDAMGESKTGIKSLFGGAKKTVDKMMAGYSKVEVNVDKISSTLEAHRRQLLKDIATYDIMFESNYNYFKELNMFIIAGKEKIKEIEQTELPRLKAAAEASGSQQDAQRLNDMQNALNRFEKKIHDLQLSRTISLQMAPQIRLIQNNDALLAEKIQSSIVNAIPLWKNQIVIAMGLANSKAALETQRKVSDMTNDLLRKNSEMLKQGTLEIAKESERGIVSIETLQKTNQDLIDTINGVLEIQKQGSEQRYAAESELVRIEDELKHALIAARN